MRHRLSPATVIALLALFVALGGTAGAAAVLVTSAQIKNGTIQLADISGKAQRALRGKRGPQGPQGPQGPAGQQGPPGSGAAALFAIVNEAGQLVRGSGATAVQRTELGRYLLTFNRQVVDCVIVGSAGTRGTTDTEQIPEGFLGSSAAGNQVAVITKKYMFTGHLQPEDLAFHLAVLC
jgi:hypothetical protein